MYKNNNNFNDFSRTNDPAQVLVAHHIGNILHYLIDPFAATHCRQTLLLTTHLLVMGRKKRETDTH